MNFSSWDVRHTEALAKLKELLTTPPVLGYYSPKQTTVIQCDASSNALGTVLLGDGHVIEYASRALTETEQRYEQIFLVLYLHWSVSHIRVCQTCDRVNRS